jgi:hypothetical protein
MALLLARTVGPENDAGGPVPALKRHLPPVVPVAAVMALSTASVVEPVSTGNLDGIAPDHRARAV